MSDEAVELAKAANATKAAEEATATLEAVVAKQRQFVGELEAAHERALHKFDQI
mgnify:FL=1